jgi:internalin A
MEKERVETTPVVIEGKVHKLSVGDLLDGVDLKGARKEEKRTGGEEKRVRVFYSYCHKDESLRNELEVSLKILERTGVIDSWHDRKIMAGEEWEDEIDEHLEAADIVLLLVSADFVASNYCYDVEMVRAMERHEAGEACVIPVVVRDVNWKKAPFAKLQALPEDAKAVMLWADRDTAWRNVSEGIEAVVGKIREER